MQRAADAAALAGAVYLPGDETGALRRGPRRGQEERLPDGVGGVTVTPRRDPENARKLIVDIDGPVQTNFARVFCWDGGPCLQSVAVGVTGAAEFVLPVPMGSPENYYGVFGTTRGLTSTEVVTETIPTRHGPAVPQTPGTLRAAARAGPDRHRRLERVAVIEHLGRQQPGQLAAEQQQRLRAHGHRWQRGPAALDRLQRADGQSPRQGPARP